MKRLRRLRAWWLDRRRIVVVPNGKTQMGGSVRVLVAQPVVAIEDLQDVRASIDQIMAATERRAHRVRSWRRRSALYRIDEPIAGRAASGHWVTGPDGMVLTAIALIPLPGFPVSA